jgi:hypothetical protein
MEGGGHISTLKNYPKDRYFLRNPFLCHDRGGVISMLINDPKYTFNIFCAIIFLDKWEDQISTLKNDPTYTSKTFSDKRFDHISTFSAIGGSYFNVEKWSKKWIFLLNAFIYQEEVGLYFNVEKWSHILVLDKWRGHISTLKNYLKYTSNNCVQSLLKEKVGSYLNIKNWTFSAIGIKFQRWKIIPNINIVVESFSLPREIWRGAYFNVEKW